MAPRASFSWGFPVHMHQRHHLWLPAGKAVVACFYDVINFRTAPGTLPQLESVLLTEGVYAGSCGDADSPCDAQISELALIFVLGSSLTTCAAIVNGELKW